MAKNIKDDSNVVHIKRGRGRPRKVVDNTQGETAPAFGHNEPTEGLFLNEVADIRLIMGEVELAKTALKNAKGKLKDRRNLAKEKGVVLGELDEALGALETERVDLLAREERRRLYFMWLGLPILELDGSKARTAAEDPAADWRKRGDTAGRLGNARDIPEGCPPEHIQDFLKGWEDGQAVLGDKFLSRAVKQDVENADVPKGAGAVLGEPEEIGLLVLREDAFAAGTSLEDANLKSLQGDRLPEFNRALSVAAVFGDRRRILKEPGLNGEPDYVDTGEADAELTEPEPVIEEQAADALA